MPDLLALLDERKRLLSVPWDEFDPVRLADVDDALIAAIPELLERCRGAGQPVAMSLEATPKS